MGKEVRCGWNSFPVAVNCRIQNLHERHPTSPKKSDIKFHLQLPKKPRKAQTGSRSGSSSQADAFQWETTVLEIQVSKISALAQSELTHPTRHSRRFLPQVRALRFTRFLLEVRFARSHLNFLVRRPVRARWGGEKWQVNQGMYNPLGGIIHWKMWGQIGPTSSTATLEVQGLDLMLSGWIRNIQD